MRLLCVVLVLVISGSASAQPAPGVLARNIFTLTINAEIEASKGTFGDPTSIAPDFSFGVTDTLTLSALHSTFGRTGFRGAAGAGICITDACPNTYDNAGVEATLGLTSSGTFAVAANAGFHATSFDRAHYGAKAGLRLRMRAGEVSLVSLPSVLIAATHRDENKDRLFVPLTASLTVAGVTFGLASGVKGTLDDLGDSYEIAAGAFVSYVASPSVAFAASYIHGKILGGDLALPDDARGVDTRAIQVWVTITRSTHVRYRRAAMNRATSVHSASN